MNLIKHIATCLLIAMGTLQSWGLAWHYSRIELRCEPADAGFVYASTESASTGNCTTTTYTGVYGRTANSSFFPCPWNIYTRPTNTKKYKFSYWECKTRVGDILEYTTGFLFWTTTKYATAVGTRYETASVENKIYVGLTKALGNPNTGVSSDVTSDPQVVNAVWVAHYELLEHHDVTVASNDNNLGAVEIIGPDGTAENQVGDQVTITARTDNHRVKFLG